MRFPRNTDWFRSGFVTKDGLVRGNLRTFADILVYRCSLWLRLVEWPVAML